MSYYNEKIPDKCKYPGCEKPATVFILKTGLLGMGWTFCCEDHEQYYKHTYHGKW